MDQKTHSDQQKELVARCNTLTRLPLCVILVLALVVFDRLRILQFFSFRWLDEDQAVMWYALREYASGRFHEPRFFGQGYSTMLEALVAVPLYLIGAVPAVALPLSTSLMALAPFFLIGILARQRKAGKRALIILSLPLFLPVKYSMLTSMPRGVVGGILLASLIVPIYPDSNRQFSWWRGMLTGGLSVVSISVNPNALIVVFPLLFYIVMQTSFSRPCLCAIGSGGFLGAIFHFVIQSFYYVHPEALQHQAPQLTFRWGELWVGLQQPLLHFGDVLPFCSPGYFGLILLIISALLWWLLVSANKHAAIAISAVVVLVIFSLGLNKSHDGYSGIYQPLSRMYLGIPIVIALSIFWSTSVAGQDLVFSKFRELSKHASIVGGLVMTFWVLLRQIHLPEIVRADYMIKQVQVRAAPVSEVYALCSELQLWSQKQQSELVIVADRGYGKLINYACPVIYESLQTLLPNYERRSWLVRKELQLKRSKILWYGFGSNFFEKNKIHFPMTQTISHSRRVVFTEIEPQPLTVLLPSVGISLRRYRLSAQGASRG